MGPEQVASKSPLLLGVRRARARAFARVRCTGQGQRRHRLCSCLQRHANDQFGAFLRPVRFREGTRTEATGRNEGWLAEACEHFLFANMPPDRILTSAQQ